MKRDLCIMRVVLAIQDISRNMNKLMIDTKDQKQENNSKSNIKKILKKWASLGTDLLPVIGPSKLIFEGVKGKNPITQQKLSTSESLIKILSGSSSIAAIITLPIEPSIWIGLLLTGNGLQVSSYIIGEKKLRQKITKKIIDLFGENKQDINQPS